MRGIRGFVLIAVLLSAGPLSAGPPTWFVAPSGQDLAGRGSLAEPFRTLQFAYDQAADGDEIRALPGTYNECLEALDATGRSIRIVAQDWLDRLDNTTTILDGSATDPSCTAPAAVVTLGGGTSALTGFTVRNGTDSGILAFGGPSITNNRIHDNTGINGGGVYLYTLTCSYGDVDATIADNEVFANRAVDTGSSFSALGGGIAVLATARAVGDGFQPACQVGGNPTVSLDDNHVHDNAAFDGGGIWVRTDSSQTDLASAVTITNSLVEGNQAGVRGPSGFLGWGGGIYTVTYGYGAEQIKVGDPLAPGSGNVVTDNLATGGGGGIATFDDTFELARHTNFVLGNEVRGNSVESLRDLASSLQGRGGGLFVSVRAIDLQGPQALNVNVGDNTIEQNTMSGIEGRGGGLAVRMRSRRSAVPMNVVVQGNRITDNDAVFRGGGVAVEALADTAIDAAATVLAANAVVQLNRNLVAANRVDDGFGLGVGGGVAATLDCCDGFINGSGVCVSGPGSALADCKVRMSGNTLTRNVSTADPGAGGIEIFSITDPAGGQSLARIEVHNSIVSSNTGFGIGGPLAMGTAETTYDIRWTDVWGNTDPADPSDATANFESTIPQNVLPPALGNLSLDPLLGGPTTDPPYAPGVCSPTLDAGNPAAAFLLEPEPNGNRVNLGYTGASPHATLSTYRIEPTLRARCRRELQRHALLRTGLSLVRPGVVRTERGPFASDRRALASEAADEPGSGDTPPWRVEAPERRGRGDGTDRRRR